jgi:hypothetical protein
MLLEPDVAMLKHTKGGAAEEEVPTQHVDNSVHGRYANPSLLDESDSGDAGVPQFLPRGAERHPFPVDVDSDDLPAT